MLESPYQIQSYKFISPLLPDRLKCIFCHWILRNAHQTPCGCLACESCIKSYLANGLKPCPSQDCESVNVMLHMEQGIYQDKATNREIANLSVKCPFSVCQTELPLQRMVEHIDSCDFRESECGKRNSKSLMKDGENCDINECEMRTIKCEFCSVEMSHKESESIHLDITSRQLCTKYMGNDRNTKLECVLHSLLCYDNGITKERLLNHLLEEHSYVTNLTRRISSLEKINCYLETELKKHKVISKQLSKENSKLKADINLFKDSEDSFELSQTQPLHLAVPKFSSGRRFSIT